MFPNPNLDKTFQLMAIYIVFVLFFLKKLWIPTDIHGKYTSFLLHLQALQLSMKKM